MLIGYARVSKADRSQSLDLQRNALRTGDVLVVWKLDRVWCEKTAEASESQRQRG